MEYAPLSASCVRSLTDKLYEKRKVGALEVEKLVKEFKKADDKDQLSTLLVVLSDLTSCNNASNKKGGLIGLAAFCIALGKDSSVHLRSLLKPITPCFYDVDSKVRYCACECLFNIVKVVRGMSLVYFIEIFDSLSKLSCDADQNVREGCKLLDRLMKEIVAEESNFDVSIMIPALRACLHTTNPFGKEFVVSWITTLQQLPGTDLTPHIPDFLDGLLLVLLDPSHDIVKMCCTCLGSLLTDVKTSSNINITSIVNILNTHAQSHDQTIQLTSLSWLMEITCLSFNNIILFLPTILTSILPCLPPNNKNSHLSKDVRDVAIRLNNHLLQTIKQATKEENDTRFSKEIIHSLVKNLCHHIEHPSYRTRPYALQWLNCLFVCLPNKMHVHYETLLPYILMCLSDSSDDVVTVTLELVSEICTNPSMPTFVPSSLSSPGGNNNNNDTEGAPKLGSMHTFHNFSLHSTSSLNSYFVFFIDNLLNHFKQSKNIVNAKGSFIIRKLCTRVDPREVFMCVSQVLSTQLLNKSNDTSKQSLSINDVEFEFVSNLVRVLNRILLTSSETSKLRIELKNLKTKHSEATRELFLCLVYPWAYNVVSSISLCLLTQNYQQAFSIMKIIGDMNVTVSMLEEIDQLVQLIESPIFSFLRLQLLEVDNDGHLVRCLYALLMLLPQSQAFHTLKHRLQCVPTLPPIRPSIEVDEKGIDFEGIMQHFKNIHLPH